MELNDKLRPTHHRRPGHDWYKVSIIDLAVLLVNAERSTKDLAHGWNDAELAYGEFLKKINQEVWLPRAILESGLYCCNINSEQKSFWHPFGYTFLTFIRKLLGSEKKFNKKYNTIMEEI